MKYTDIPQLTKDGSYQVNMPLNYIERARFSAWTCLDSGTTNKICRISFPWWKIISNYLF